MNRKISSYFLVLLLLGTGGHATLAAEPDFPPLPPLNDPASGDYVHGKFIWTDIFTSDVPAARKFYSELFEWEWRWVNEDPEHLYGMFYQDGVAMAGLAEREPQEEGAAYARWVYYISTADVKAAVKATTEAGGRVMLGPLGMPNRGDFAVLADPENAPFGVMHSSSGDPPDYRAEIGQWLWVGFYSEDAKKASKFYGSVFGYEVRDYGDRPDIIDYVLEAGGYARAGVGQLSPDSESKPTWLGFV